MPCSQPPWRSTRRSSGRAHVPVRPHAPDSDRSVTVTTSLKCMAALCLRSAIGPMWKSIDSSLSGPRLPLTSAGGGG